MGGFKFVAADGKREDSNVDGACAESVEKHGSDFFDDGEPNLWEFAREGCEDRRQKIRADRGMIPTVTGRQ